MKHQSYLLSLNCGTEYIHNAGTHYVMGKQCKDCGRFIRKGTLEYFMTIGITDISLALHNRKVAFLREETANDLHDDLKELEIRLYDRKYLLSLNKSEAQQFMDETYRLLSKHGINDMEAIEILK